jgi:predicted nucleotide-binding protein
MTNGTPVVLVPDAALALRRELGRWDLTAIGINQVIGSGVFILPADVGFAIVLLTPDDRGGPMAVPYEQQQPRARQNVILELAYSLGWLGRNRVCVLYREGLKGKEQTVRSEPHHFG